MSALQGKVAVVTGGGDGIGAAVCVRASETHVFLGGAPAVTVVSLVIPQP